MKDALTIRAAADRLPLAAASVHCVVTSPPYYGLRDYGLGATEWPAIEYVPMIGATPVSIPPMACELGQEPDPMAYIGHIVHVFREVARVLRPDGTLWLNLGDSYSSRSGKRGDGGSSRERSFAYRNRATPAGNPMPGGIPPKNLMGIPWRVALALQADGWTLRSEVIWQKPDAMPNSVWDRPTTSHEQVFIFSRARHYYYDRFAILEPHTSRPQRRPGGHRPRSVPGGGPTHTFSGSARTERAHDGHPAGRNRRTVWSIATACYAGAHFAAFPEGLATIPILAGTSARGVCPHCGAPWRREVDTVPMQIRPSERRESFAAASLGATARTAPSGTVVERGRSVTTGWAQSCECPAAEPVGAVVLDPFAGTGTVGRVALAYGRRAVLADLSLTYLHEHVAGRLTGVQPDLFGGDTAAPQAATAPEHVTQGALNLDEGSAS